MVENDSLGAYIPSEKFEYRDFGSTIDKNQILKEFLKNIFRLSDEEYQERVWIRGAYPSCNEIDDVVCDFFDDGDPILGEFKDFGITESQYKLLMESDHKNGKRCLKNI